LEKELTGKVFDIQGFSIQDGPGIRTTVFFKGCPLHCPWCHSPESQKFEPELSWLSVRCIGVEKCGKCLSVCPHGAISAGDLIQQESTRESIQLIQIDRSLCDVCGQCTAACYPKALSICGTDYTVEALAHRVSKDIPFYENSGGGVTVSGGEPLSQAAFLLRFLIKLKEHGIHTAVDTTGYVPYERIEQILPYTDLFLYDLKHMNSEKHKAVTGVRNELILENARKIALAGGKMQIRIPLIPQFNDSEEVIKAMGWFCRSLEPAVTLIQLLPYHNLGVMKYQRIANSCAIFEATPIQDHRVESLKKILEAMKLTVTIH
jgi:pyruvate formate lyase activating enzyme